jgi:hypothetical protein
MKEAADVKRAAGTVEAVRAQITELEEQVAIDVAAIAAGFDVGSSLERVVIAPKRGHVDVRFVALGWLSEDAEELGEARGG